MHVVITGASSGIGAALARAFAATGAHLTLVARRADALRSVAAELAVPVHLVAHDLSAPARAADILASARAAFGPIDVLVNNAGVQILGPTDRIDPDAGDRLIALNLLTPLRLAAAVIPDLRRTGGTLVNVASLAALAPTPGMTWYNASKGGLAAASEALRGELRGSGVNVLTVYPGIVKTGMADRAMASVEPSRLLALQPEATADALAEAIVRAVTRRHARLVYPRVYAPVRWIAPVARWFMDRFTPAFRLEVA